MAHRFQQGFSLIELMIVVGIISLLALSAKNSFTAFLAKAKQAEAKTMLQNVATLAESHHIENGTYVVSLPLGRLTDDTDNGACGTPDYCVVANALGFKLDCQSRRYDYSYVGTVSSYTVTATEISPTGGTCAQVRSLFPGCTMPVFDRWRLTNSTSATNITKAIEYCL